MKPKSTRLLLAAAITSVLALSSSAFAANFYWDGTADVTLGASDNTNTAAQDWLSGGLWDDGTTSAALATWTAGDSAIFGGSAASQTITAGTFTVGNLTFGSGAAGAGTSGTAYTITGGAITLGTVTGSTITTNTDTTISSALVGQGTMTNGTVTGGKSLTKEGIGTLTLTSSSNNYNGGTTINAGTLSVTGSAKLVSGTGGNIATTVNTGGTLEVDSLAWGTDGGNLGYTWTNSGYFKLDGWQRRWRTGFLCRHPHHHGQRHRHAELNSEQCFRWQRPVAGRYA